MQRPSSIVFVRHIVLDHYLCRHAIHASFMYVGGWVFTHRGVCFGCSLRHMSCTMRTCVRNSLRLYCSADHDALSSSEEPQRPSQQVARRAGTAFTPQEDHNVIMRTVAAAFKFCVRSSRRVEPVEKPGEGMQSEALHCRVAVRSSLSEGITLAGM